MTYLASDQSVEDGSPIELHQFTYDNTHYRYTSADEDYVDAASNVWQSVAIRRQGISEDQAESRSSMTLQCAYNLAVIDPFRTGLPMMVYNAFQLHRTDVDDQVTQVFSGRVRDVVLSPDDMMATITCQSLITVLDEFMLRRKLQIQCPHALYGADCKATRAAFEIPVTVTAVNGKTVTLTGAGLAGKDDNYFPGGYIEWVNPELNVNEKMLISVYDEVTQTATLVAVPIGLSALQSASVFPGCQHTMDDCTNKFNNLDNYGGMPFIPTKNPFGSNPLF